ncbi:hypothetical protein ANO11243_017780 [Dothideomycetidae sp. 11243]|nr:hypothetical protein ANO11243_017780 [fungal sp. No.11243]
MLKSTLCALVGCASISLASVLATPPHHPHKLDRRQLSPLVTEIIGDFLKATDCAGCDAEDPDVCTGAIGSEGPILAADLRGMTIPSTTSQLFCITLAGLCDYPPVDPYTIPFPTPNPPGSCPASPSGQTPIKVVHISDIHIDPAYEVGANANCTKPICCRPYTTADSPGNNNDPAGPYGNTKCDAPVSLEESMYDAINQFAPDAAFTIFTGDVVEHDIWLVNEAEAISDINDANTRMKAKLNLVYPVVGNHESAPVNAFPPMDLAGTASNQWVYDTLSNDWKSWIGAAAANSTDHDGSYSILHPGSNLRIISFNTNFYYKENFWLYEPTIERDPDGQLAWLVSELESAESSGERVWIIGHMPMGCGDALHDGSNYFNQIITRYSKTISGLFFGHTHIDQFEIAYSDYTAQSAENAIAMSYITPSMTPTSGPPAFRVYDIDPVTFGVLDFTVYIANISDPAYQSGPVWQKYYSAKETYGPLANPPVTDPAAELTPGFWHSVTDAFNSNDAEFQAYIARQSRGFAVKECTGTCKTQEICQLKAAEAQYNCVPVVPGISFTKKHKRDVEEGLAYTSDCGGSVLIKTVKSLVHGDVDVKKMMM